MYLLETPTATIGAALGASAPAALRSAKARALRLRFIHGQRPAIHGLTVQAGNSPLEVFTLRQFDKAKSPRCSRQLVANHHRGGYLKAGIDHEFVKLGVGDAMG